MASISSLSGSSSSSSIYGTRNVLSGLASGMDTESMIENAVSGYQLKITQLQQQRTKVEWQQEAYRSMISKMVNFSQKYTSYTSGTNLLSESFFNSAMKVNSLGENASKVSANGRTSSDVVINSVERLATAARYSVDPNNNPNLKLSNVAGQSFSLSADDIAVGTLKGTLTLGYGGKSVQLSFTEDDVYKTAQEMVDGINKKLEDESIAFDGGTQAKASERIRAVLGDDGSTVAFQLVKSDDGNGVWIERGSGNVASSLGFSVDADDDTSVKSFQFDKSKVTKEMDMVNLLQEKGFSITLNGDTETIIPNIFWVLENSWLSNGENNPRLKVERSVMLS